MAWGLFEALGSAVESVRSFFSGVFGQAAREEIEFPTISEALEAGGLDIEIPALHEDFRIQEEQTFIAEMIAARASGELVPGNLHLETDRLLPHKFAYEVSVTQYDAEGTPTEYPYYVGSDKRLTPDEILDIADGEVQNSPAKGAVGYELGGITASWVCTEY